MLSNDGSTWSPPVPYATSMEWDFTLHGGNDDEGIKTIYVKFMDAAGNWMQNPVSDDIKLDMTGPTGTVVINGGLPLTSSPLVKLGLLAFDESGVESMQFSNNGIDWSPLEDYNIVRDSWDISTEEYGGDSVGNISKKSITGSIRLKTGALATVQISAPEIEGKIKNGDLVNVNGISERDLSSITMEVLDDSGYSLDIDLTGVVYEASTGQITGSFNVGELAAKTIRFRISVEDSLGNQAEAVSNALVVDNEPPGNTEMNIVQTSPVNSTSIDLSMSAADALEMHIFGDVEEQNIWIPFAETLTVKLVEGDGIKQVSAKFRDDMKNESEEIARQITLDTTPPAGAIVINNGDEFTRTFLVTLTLSASDKNGVESYQLSSDGSKWTDELPVDGGTSWDYEWDLSLSKYGGSSEESSHT